MSRINKISADKVPGPKKDYGRPIGPPRLKDEKKLEETKKAKVEKDNLKLSDEVKEEIESEVKEMEEGEKKTGEKQEPKTPGEQEKQKKLKELKEKMKEVREKLREAIKNNDYEEAKNCMRELNQLGRELEQINNTPASQFTPSTPTVPGGGVPAGGGAAPAAGGVVPAGGAAPAYGGALTGGAAPATRAPLSRPAASEKTPEKTGDAPASAIKPDGSGQDAANLAKKYEGYASIACKGKLPTFRAAGGTGNNCADFVGACLEATGRLKGSHSASVKVLEQQLKKQGYVQVPANQAKPGDVWIRSDRGHTELVVENSGGNITTIGSNGGATNQKISRRSRPGGSGGVIYQLREG